MGAMKSIAAGVLFLLYAPAIDFVIGEQNGRLADRLERNRD